MKVSKYKHFEHTTNNFFKTRQFDYTKAYSSNFLVIKYLSHNFKKIHYKIKKTIEILQKLDIVLEEGKLMYFYHPEKKYCQNNEIKFENNEMKLSFLQFTSSYAQVYHESHHSNRSKSDSLITDLQEKSKINPDNLTFEYSLSQITFNFKALVDYIWYRSTSYKPYAILQALDYNHLNYFKSKF